MADSKETGTLHDEHTGLHNEHGALVKGQKANRTVFICSTVVLWLLTMFVIAALNKTNSRLEEMQQSLDSITGIVTSLPACEIQDVEGKVVYRIAIVGAEVGGDVSDDEEGEGK